MKFWSRAVRILLATIVATQGAAFIPALAASQSKRLAVKAIGIEELKSEYGAGGGGGGGDPPPDPVEVLVPSPNNYEYDVWEYYASRTDPEIRLSTTYFGPWNNTGPSTLKLNGKYDGYCSVSGGWVSSEGIGVNFSCDGNYGFEFNDYEVPSGYSVNLYKAVKKQSAIRIEWLVRRGFNGQFIRQYNEYREFTKTREWTSYSVTGYRI